MPSFANTYFKRFQAEQPLIEEAPHADLFLTVVIPCHNEPDLIRSLQSLRDCEIPQSSVEVIVVINASETDPTGIIERNRVSYRQAIEFSKRESCDRLRFHCLNFETLPRKFAGVGLARKIGMDESLHRYNRLNRPEGLIIGFDADSTVAPDYFTEIEKLFRSKPKTNACSIRFEHPISGTEHAPEIYRSIIDYELHLRYFVEALRYAGLPFAYHTIGSAFAVRADVYAAQGGMNKKKAGEDFYFLQKIIPLGRYEELNATCVYPSPRVSDRVPFGTGAAVRKMTESKSTEYLTYRFESFEVLKVFFTSIESYFKEKEVAGLDPSLEAFLKLNGFEAALKEIKENSSDRTSFRNRFFLWFNAFRTMKYLNFAHEHHFERTPVARESMKLLDAIHLEAPDCDTSEKLLFLYRGIDMGFEI
jgi:glycosyltransferase involved in cell wall biosynthesis